MERKEIYRFSEWFVGKVGELVGEARREGRSRGLVDEEVRRAMLIAFQTLGEQARLSFAALNRKLGKLAKRKEAAREDDLSP